MSQRILDEREHRRGLVLGLTLAEILLLLLFLLLLSLGARLNQLKEAQQSAESDRDRLRKAAFALPSIKSSGDIVSELKKLKVALEPLKGVSAVHLRDNLVTIKPVISWAEKVDPEDPPAVLKRVLKILQRLGPVTRSDKDLDQLLARLGKTSWKSQIVTGSVKRGHNWPPIISLSEADGYFFESGSAEISQSFRANLTAKVVPTLLKTIQQYDVNVVEVIGHTDEQQLNVRGSDLDTTLIPFLDRSATTVRITPADNAGLGLARAASVVRILSADKRLQALSIRILPLSGGQLIEIGDKLSKGLSPGDRKERRRIEIRVRGHSHIATPGVEGFR